MLDEAKNLTFSKFRIRVTSTVVGFFSTNEIGDQDDLLEYPTPTIETSGVGVPASDRYTPADKMQRIQRLLSTPRRDFWYAMQDVPHIKGETTPFKYYQILVAASGDRGLIDSQNRGSESSKKYFQDIFGVDITLKYNSNVTESGKIVKSRCADANGGPTPIDVNIEEIFGGQAFRVSFEIEVCRVMCNTNNGEFDDTAIPSELHPDYLMSSIDESQKILSNTWSVEETCDDQWRRTKAIEGELRVRDSRYIAQKYRALVLPSLIPGYRRTAMRFASDPTNLVLKYRVEDKQAEAAPPAPAIDWKVTHVDSARDEYGQVERQVTIELVGPPRVDKKSLMGLALNLLDARFHEASKPLANRIQQVGVIPYVRQALIITQAVHSPTITLMCNIRVTAEPILGGPASFHTAIFQSSQGIDTTPVIGGQPNPFAGYNPERWPIPRPFESNSPWGIFATYLQSPCSVWHAMPEYQRIQFDTGTNPIGNDAPGVMPPETPKYWVQPEYTYYPSPTAFIDKDNLPATTYNAPGASFATHEVFPYTHVDVDTRYSADSGVMALPLSGKRKGQPRHASLGGGNAESTIVTIPVHAGIMTRTLVVNATRHGRPPELPEPKQRLVDPNGVVETLIGKTDLVLDAPKLSSDNTHRVFSGQMRITYVLSRPLTTAEKYRCANNPMLNSYPGHNWIPGAAMFGQNRIEYDEPITEITGGAIATNQPVEVIPPGSMTAVDYATKEVGAGYDHANRRRAAWPQFEDPRPPTS